MIYEPGFTSTRTDAQSYAEKTLKLLAGIIVPLSERRRGYLRDELIEAFESGEHQGVCRAIAILSIAKANATSSEAISALDACLRILVDA